MFPTENKVKLFFDMTNVEEPRVINSGVLEKVFDESGLVDNILFSTEEEIKSLNIHFYLKDYADKMNLDGLVKFLHKYKFYIDYFNTAINLIVFRVDKK